MARLVTLALFALVALSTPAWGQTPVIYAQRVNFGPGAVTSPAIDVPPGTGDINLKIDVNLSDWADPDLRISGLLEGSKDGGATWEHLSGFSAVGDTYNKAGQPAGATGVARDLSAFTHIRGTLSVNKRIRIGITGEMR